MKLFVITGTRKGIGKLLAEYYLGKGNRVIGCSRKGGTIEHEAYHHYCLDVTDEKAVIRMIREASKKWGGIDVLLNNAGIAAMNALLLTPLRTARSVMETNFLGTFLLLREAAKSMVRRKNGRIVNFTTVAVPFRLDGEAVYAASKAAVESLTQIAARELAPHGITVNAIGPTPIETDLIKLVPREKIEALVERQAVRRMGGFEDIRHVVDFFISEDSNFITGQILYLGGVHG